MILAPDGVRLSVRHDACAADRGLAMVVAHGFTGSWRRPPVRAVVRGLRVTGGVVSFDFRGHGESSGSSTVGDKEILDLDACVRWARLLGYRRVATVGWSMGAAVAVRHAGEIGGVDAVVAVSGPSRWNYRGTGPMRRLHRGLGTTAGRAILGVAYGTRVHSSGWGRPPLPPDTVVARIAPTPLLLVHGDADHYFPLEHALWLARAAGPGCELWVEPGMGHAEAAATPELVGRIGSWVAAAVHGRPEAQTDGAGAPADDGRRARMPA